MLGAVASFQSMTPKQPLKSSNLFIYNDISMTPKLKSSINFKTICKTGLNLCYTWYSGFFSDRGS